jgi:hypothetical protein
MNWTYLGEDTTYLQHLQLAARLVVLHRQFFHLANVLILRHAIRYQNLLQTQNQLKRRR